MRLRGMRPARANPRGGARPRGPVFVTFLPTALRSFRSRRVEQNHVSGNRYRCSSCERRYRLRAFPLTNRTACLKIYRTTTRLRHWVGCPVVRRCIDVFTDGLTSVSGVASAVVNVARRSRGVEPPVPVPNRGWAVRGRRWTAPASVPAARMRRVRRRRAIGMPAAVPDSPMRRWNSLPG